MIDEDALQQVHKRKTLKSGTGVFTWNDKERKFEKKHIEFIGEAKSED